MAGRGAPPDGDDPTTPPRTIPDLLRRAADGAAGRPWVSGGDRTLSFGAALEAVERAAAALRGLGVGPGQVVMSLPRTTVDHVLAWLAVMEVGAVQVPVNPASTPSELAGLVAQSEPVLVLADLDLMAAASAALAAAGRVAGVVETAELFSAGRDGRGPAPLSPGDVAVMIPTSGTTGRSKLVMQTHRAYVMAGEGFPHWLGLTADDRLMTCLPLFHLNAPAYSVLGSLAARAGLVLVAAFSAGGFLDQARRHGATQFNSIGAMLEILMRQPPRPDDAGTALRLCYTGPSPTRERHLEIEARFGLEVTCGYALSESPYGLIWPRGARPFGSLGSPRQHPRLGLVNEARVRGRGGPAGMGEVGELELRNPAVMAGYHRMAAETAAVLVEGWLRTGDLVREGPPGTYTFVGRVKEVIRRRGENLSPGEVEAVLEAHPSVLEAAVVGVPCELTEEEVKAFVTQAGDAPVDAAELRAHCAGRLAPFKVPRYYEVVPELPRTATGRLARHRLPTDRTPGEVDLAPAPPGVGGPGRGPA